MNNDITSQANKPEAEHVGILRIGNQTRNKCIGMTNIPNLPDGEYPVYLSPSTAALQKRIEELEHQLDTERELHYAIIQNSNKAWAEVEILKLHVHDWVRINKIRKRRCLTYRKRIEELEAVIGNFPCITSEELSALLRFKETCDDDEGYDVPKEMMKRLALTGAVRHVTAGIYEITKYGFYLLDNTLKAGDVHAPKGWKLDADRFNFLRNKANITIDEECSDRYVEKGELSKLPRSEKVAKWTIEIYTDYGLGEDEYDLAKCVDEAMIAAAPTDTEGK